MVGACVQIAGIEEPHPKKNETETDAGPMNSDAGPMNPDAGPLDPEWANWPMPNPKDTVLPNPANYMINMGMGLVVDDVTKLMWQREISGGIDGGSDGGSDAFSWADAKAHCADLGLGSYDDWRLPTAIELVSLVDYTKASPGPTIDTNAFPDAPPDLFFWAASPLAGSSSEAWVVNFATGESSADDVTSMHPVRCVRLSDSTP
jgi:hypothetical protein